MTPLLLPVWWAATFASASTTTTDAPASRARAMAVARPTAPAPTTTTSKRAADGGAAGDGADGAWVMVIEQLRDGYGEGINSAQEIGARLPTLSRYAGRGLG